MGTVHHDSTSDVQRCEIVGAGDGDQYVAKPTKKRMKRRPGPAGGVRDLNRRAQAQRLCDAALALYLEHGLGSVTIDQIVDRAGVAKGSFYRYFADQTALVDALLAPFGTAMRAALEHAETRLSQAARPDELSAIYLALATELSAVVAPSPALLRFYLQECRSPPIGARRTVRLLADDIARRGIRLSEVARDFGLVRNGDPRVVALSVIGAVERLTLGVLGGEDLGRLDALPVTLISVILDGVRRTP
jgi:AcrR family transcriptional regulator